MMSRADRIRDGITRTLAPLALEVIDESDQHIGHPGHQPGGESHFRVRLRAPGLAGLSRLQRQRAVHRALGSKLLSEIHALSIEITVD